MTAIQEIKHGAPAWDSAVNANFAALNTDLQKVGGVTDSLSWSNTITEGIVLLNPDWEINTQNTGYRFSTMGSNRLVSLTIVINPNKKTTAGLNGENLIQVPHVIHPSHTLCGMSDSRTCWASYGGDEFVFRQINGADTAYETWMSLVVNATYVI